MHQNPSLIIKDSTKFRAPEIPADGDPEVTTWCDRHGVPGAFSHVVNEERWLHVLGVASFKLDLADNTVVAVPWKDARTETIVNEFQSTVWPTVLQIQGCEALHASAVSTPLGVVTFCAASEGGKSTLAYALSWRGYAHWADDAVVLEISPGLVRAHPLPFQIRLRSDAALHFGYSVDQVEGGRLRYNKGQQHAEVVPLRAICLLQAETLPESRAIKIEPLIGASALLGVLEHALYFSLQDPQRKRRMMQQYLNLVGQVPIFAVHMGRGLELLPRIVDQLEKDILASCQKRALSIHQ